MKTQCLSLDRISTLPQNIIDDILTLMPIRDALRTSVLSKKWRYSWRSMPKLVFTDDMVKPHCKKYKLVNAIFHVLLLHDGPTILDLFFSVGKLQMVSELDQILSYLSRGTNVKELTVGIIDGYYNLPVSFFSMQGLERLFLRNCGFKPPLTVNGFSRLREIVFTDVEVSANMFQGFFSKCPLLDAVGLGGYEKGIDITIGGNKFTFGDFFRCVPLIQYLDFSNSYMKYFSAGGMPHKLPTSPTHLKYLYLDVCLMEHNEIAAVLCILRSSPLLVSLVLKMCDNDKLHVQQTSTNFLDSEGYTDLKLDHLEMFELDMFSNSPLESKLVKLIMAKSHVLKKVKLLINENVSVDEELNMHRDWLLLPFPRASLSATLIISVRYEG